MGAVKAAGPKKPLYGKIRTSRKKNFDKDSKVSKSWKKLLDKQKIK